MTIWNENACNCHENTVTMQMLVGLIFYRQNTISYFYFFFILS